MRNEGPVYGNRKPQRLCAYLPVGKLQAGVGVRGRSILTSTTNEGCGGGTPEGWEWVDKAKASLWAAAPPVPSMGTVEEHGIGSR